LNPELAQGEEDRFERFRQQVGDDLFPLGEAFDGHGFLAIDRAGRIFFIGDAIWLMGNDIRTALDTILVGRSPRELG
jgi:hypothetical protein